MIYSTLMLTKFGVFNNFVFTYHFIYSLNVNRKHDNLGDSLQAHILFHVEICTKQIFK